MISGYIIAVIVIRAKRIDFDSFTIKISTHLTVNYVLAPCEKQ